MYYLDVPTVKPRRSTLMRIRIAVLLASCVALGAPSAWAQAPGQLPPGPPGMAEPGAPPGPPGMTQPGPMYAPPPVAWSPPGPPQVPVYAVPFVPRTDLPPEPPPPPFDLAGRVGFGLGISIAPGLGALGGLGAQGTGSLATGSLGIRWWARERVVLLPQIHLAVSHQTRPTNGSVFTPNSFTSGTVAPGLSVGYVAYRGHSTRFILSGGVAFSYDVSPLLSESQLGNGGFITQFVAVKTLSFTVPVGLALEQLLTPRISVVVGADSPLFAYSSQKVADGDATTSIGAEFQATRFSASIFFYTD